MAVIHNTAMTPGTLELLAAWLPTQPWYVETDREPELTQAGGFRLDDPQGEVEIEFMVVTDESGDPPISYHVPLTYRGAPLARADDALIGTAEHGELGRRWVYDGTHDPVLIAQLLALLQSRAEPQAQSATDTPDPSVTTSFSGAALSIEIESVAVANGPYGTDIVLESTTEAEPDSESAGLLIIRVTRVLRPDQQFSCPSTTEARGHVTAGWRSPDGDESRGVFVALCEAAP
ncbi:MAG: hypothetical protein JWO67_7273 [Streptosporangiaceae bacterium]|nr:hypothetical protein [Streptosporangiaceae bacterium]